ncbi:MAG: DUF1015 domain-containing protein [Deltaproteobacteria bacterium]
MVLVRGFSGVRYNPSTIEDFASVVSPPYDVISPEEQSALYARHPHNVVRLEYNSAEGDAKYAEASRIFRQWLDAGILIQDGEPSIYAYYQEFEEGGRVFVRRGFLAAVKIEDFDARQILPHERTFPKHKEDRLKLAEACGANLSPVFAVYSDPEGGIESEIDREIARAKPDVVAHGADGIRNKMWRISDADLISRVQAAMSGKTLLIADGHHRYETAINYRNIQRRKNGAAAGDEPYEFVMIYLSRAEGEGLIIKPTHRAVKTLGSLDAEGVIQKLAEGFNISEVSADEILRLASDEFAAVLPAGKTLKISPKYASYDEKSLAVITLHSRVFGEILDEEQSRILYTKSLPELLLLVEGGAYKMGFALPAISPLEVLQVSMEGEKMPHKTTYFYPKLLSGLAFHLLG